ncbi:MAG: hypothetical protein ACJAY7_001037 [Pseudohongiellaceae bacterium]|jgi:hypothetical protein
MIWLFMPATLRKYIPVTGARSLLAPVTGINTESISVRSVKQQWAG